MRQNEILEKVQEIFRDIFDDRDLIIELSTNADDIEDWDSLNHINLIVAIEKDFEVKFSIEELQSLKDVGDTVALIEKKLGQSH